MQILKLSNWCESYKLEEGVKVNICFPHLVLSISYRHSLEWPNILARDFSHVYTIFDSVFAPYHYHIYIYIGASLKENYPNGARTDFFPAAVWRDAKVLKKEERKLLWKLPKVNNSSFSTHSTKKKPIKEINHCCNDFS